jgi:hypothetical protein
MEEREKPIATNRPKYRSGNKETAVKAYTILQESKFLIVRNVPALGNTEELMKLFSLYGTIEEYRLLDEEAAVEFTDVYWIKFKNIAEARVAKRKCDDYNFLGKLLDVEYAPQFESLQDTREKLEERRRIVGYKLHQVQASNKPKHQAPLPPGRLSADQLPFEAPPERIPGGVELLPPPRTIESFNRPPPQNAPGPSDGRKRPAPSQNPVPLQPHHKETRNENPYYGDSSVNATVLSIRNKLQKISEPGFSKPAPSTTTTSAPFHPPPARERKRI